jgi:predicted porin
MGHHLKVAFAAIAASTLAVGTAFAQSSVTLYGSVDGGLAYVHNAVDVNGKNASSLFKFSSGALHSNRWGFRGSEDLGDGLSAIFTLENGFDLGAGTLSQGGREFGRQAFVGLVSREFGSVTFGRQYDPNVDLLLPLTADVTFGKTFGTPGDVDNYDDTARVNNSVKYTSPTLYGLVFSVIYGFGGVAGSTGEGQTYGAGLRYDKGPFSVAGAYYHADAGNVITNGVRTWSGSSDSLFISVINQGYASAKSLDIARVAARYAKDALMVGITYSNVRYSADQHSVFTQTEVFNLVTVFGQYKITKQSEVGVGYIYTKSSGQGSATYNQVNVGYDYSPSKTTELYVLAGWQKASGTTLDSAGKPIAAAASIGSYVVNSGTDSQGLVILGMRHRF